MTSTDCQVAGANFKVRVAYWMRQPVLDAAGQCAAHSTTSATNTTVAKP